MAASPVASGARAAATELHAAPHPPRADAAIHESARLGFGAATIAAYEKGRPEYSREHVDRVLDVMGISGAADAATGLFPALPLLELGAGTGKFTKALAAALAARAPQGSRPDNVIMVEPAGMGSMLPEVYPRLRYLPTRAEELGELPDASVCGAVAQQAFHWMATREAVKEIHRVLAPGGVFVVAWNMRDREAAPWSATFEALLDEYHNDGVTPRQTTGEWRKPLAQAEADGLFGPLRSERLAHEGGGTLRSAAGLVQWVLSLSVVAKQPAEVQADIAARVRAVLAEQATPVEGATEEGTGAPQYLIPMAYELHWVKKL
jgi:SAM-dependent methyltransferase